MRYILIGIVLMALVGMAGAARYPGGFFSGDVDMYGYNLTNATTLGSFSGSYLSGTLNVAGATGLNTTTVTSLDASDDVDIDNTLQVGGASDFKDIDINDTLDVDNAVNVGGTATLSAANVNASLGVHGGIYGDSVLSVISNLYAGALFSNGTLDVDTHADIDNTLQVGGDADMDDVDINNTLDVDNAANVGGTATVSALVANTTVSAPADGVRANSVILPGEMVLTFHLSKADIAAGEINNSALFIADDAWTITSIEEAHPVAESTATTLTIGVQKMRGTQTLVTGCNLTTLAFSLKGTANTVQTGALSTTSGITTLADGDRLGIICNMTGVAGASEFLTGGITVHIKRV